MPYVGIFKRGSNYALTEPHSHNSETVWFSDSILEEIIRDQPGHQGDLFKAYTEHNTGFWNNLWSIFRTENAFWHIHGVITTATLFFAVVYPLAALTGVQLNEPYLPPSEISFFAGIALGSSLFSFYALYRRKRQLKRRAALWLFTTYIFFLSFFIIKGIPNVYQFLTTLAFALILAVLHNEWSK